jgi:hypothetical protein
VGLSAASRNIVGRLVSVYDQGSILTSPFVYFHWLGVDGGGGLSIVSQITVRHWDDK